METGKHRQEEKFLVAKKKAMWTVYQAKCKSENVMQQEDQKYDAFKIANNMVKTNSS